MCRRKIGSVPAVPFQGRVSEGFAGAGNLSSGIPNTGIRHRLIKQTSGFNIHSIVECFLNYILYGLFFPSPFFSVKPFTLPPPYLRFKAFFHYGGGRGGLAAALVF